VIDIGVGKGTWKLYKAFPESFFLLIEPLKNFEPDLKNILKQYKGEYVLAAASRKSGKTVFNVHEDHLQGSSIFKESMGVEADGHEIIVPLAKIDDIIIEKQLKGPYLIKADVQGAELDALDGSSLTMQNTEAIIVEVSLFEFMKGAPQFYDVVHYMKCKGFVAYDIILGWNRPLDNALGQIDMVFVKENSFLRRNHSFS
ncbi:MAG: FkbM family methyltransferase, partial [Desulfamplus sp.]|nr:FkbM family methyltransferase [Desulfamplus sp.]